MTTMEAVMYSTPVSTDSNSVSYESTSSNEIAEYLNEDLKRNAMPTIVFIGAEIILGFFGNLLVLYVFGLRYHACSYRYFVLSLAVIDILTTVTTMPGEMITQLYWYVYSVNLVCKVKSFCNVFTVTAEALCFLAIAYDRFRKVCRPLAWQIKPNHAMNICCGIPLLSLLIALPTPFLWGERSVMKTYKNSTVNVTICEKDERFDSTDYPLIYISVVSVIIYTILAVIFSKYIHIFVKIIQSRRQRRRGNNPYRKGVILSADSEGRIVSKTLIMSIVTLTFIVTTIVYFILVSVIASANDILQTITDPSKATYFFFLRLYFINHVINPFIYGILDSEFKSKIGSEIVTCISTIQTKYKCIFQ